MSLLFISDLHLSADRPQISAAFCRFLRGPAGRAEALYILGDLFDAWLGADDDSPLSDQIRQALYAFSRTGTPLFCMRGNRDFLLGEDFGRATGCRLLHDPCVIHHANHALLLMHGDSLCTEDQDYMAFRRRIRDPGVQARLLALPLAERRATAMQLRALSRAATSNKASDITDVSAPEVRRQMRHHGVRTLIHGHTHRPAIHSLKVDGQPCQRIVLGDWDTHGWALRWEQGAGKLLRFSLTDPDLAPA